MSGVVWSVGTPSASPWISCLLVSYSNMYFFLDSREGIPVCIQVLVHGYMSSRFRCASNAVTWNWEHATGCVCARKQPGTNWTSQVAALQLQLPIFRQQIKICSGTCETTGLVHVWFGQIIYPKLKFRSQERTGWLDRSLRKNKYQCSVSNYRATYNWQRPSSLWVLAYH